MINNDVFCQLVSKPVLLNIYQDSLPTSFPAPVVFYYLRTAKSEKIQDALDSLPFGIPRVFLK